MSTLPGKRCSGNLAALGVSVRIDLGFKNSLHDCADDIARSPGDDQIEAGLFSRIYKPPNGDYMRNRNDG